MTDFARVVAEKLDADLLQLLSERRFAERASFPVVVTPRSGLLDEVASLVVVLDGEVRHRIESIGVVSAWLTSAAIAELSTRDAVQELELAQPMRIADDICR